MANSKMMLFIFFIFMFCGSYDGLDRYNKNHTWGMCHTDSLNGEWNPKDYNMSSFFVCRYFCVTLNEALCLCHFPWLEWTFTFPLVKLDLDCEIFHCDFGYNGIAYYNNNEEQHWECWLYSEPQYNGVSQYNLDGLYHDPVKKKSLFNFDPGKEVLVNTPLGIRGLCLTALIAEYATCTLYYDFGDGHFGQYIHQWYTPYYYYTYKKVGVFLLTATIQYGLSYSYTTSYWINVIDLIKGEIESCSHTVYFLDSVMPFNCTGVLYSGSKLAMEWDFDEEEKPTFNITDAKQLSFYFNNPCFDTCDISDVSHDSLIPVESDITKDGLYLVMHSAFEQDGEIVSIEIYVNVAQPTTLKVYRRSSDGRYLFVVHTYQLVGLTSNEKNIVLLNNNLSIKRRDYIGFVVTNSFFASLVKCRYCKVNFYGNSNLELLDSPLLSFTGYSFRIKIDFKVIVAFIGAYNFTMTGYHNISFKGFLGQDKLGFQSEGYRVAVKSKEPKINIGNYTNVVYINQYFDLCVTLINAGLTEVKWNSTTNEGIFHKHNDNIVDLNNAILSIHSEETFATKEIKECITLNITSPGNHTFMVTVISNNFELAWELLYVSAYIPMTGLLISNLSLPNPLYQLEQFILQGTMDPYIENITLQWNAPSNLTQVNINGSENSIIHVHANKTSYTDVGYYGKDFGIFTIALIASFPPISELATFNVTIIETFNIIGILYAQLNKSLSYQFTSLITFQPYWTLHWSFSDGLFLNSTNGTSVEKTFTEPGRHDIICGLNTTNEIVEVRSETFVLQNITNLQIVLLSKSILKKNFTAKAQVDLGNFLSYSWNSNVISIFSVNESEAILNCNETGLKMLSVNASNEIYWSVTNQDVFIADAMTLFIVTASKMNIETGELISFSVNTTGGSNKTVEYIFGDDNSTIVRNLEAFDRLFTTPGIHNVTANMLMLDRKENCLEISLVPCSVKLNIGVFNRISKLTVEYISTNYSILQINHTFYYPSRNNLTFILSALNSTQVLFDIIINGQNSGNINPHPIENATFANVTLSGEKFYDVSVYNFQIIAQHEISNLSQNIFMYVEDAIDGLELHYPPTVETKDIVNFDLSFKYGSNLKYLWQFQDGFVSYNKSFKRDFPNSGIYNFTISVHNNISSFYQLYQIKILKTIKGLNITCGKQHIQTDEFVYYSLGFSEGNEISIEVTNNDILPNITLSGLIAPYNNTSQVFFQTAGIKEINIRLFNVLRTLVTFQCVYYAQHPIFSASIDMFPPSITFVQEIFYITLHVFGGTNSTAIIKILTQNNFTVYQNVQIMDLHNENGLRKAVIEYVFNTGDAYFITAEIFNEISNLKVTSKSIFVIDSTQQVETSNDLSLFVESTIFSNPTNIYLNKKSSVTYLYCDLDFNDDTPIYHFSSSITFPIFHKFTNPGSYLIKGLCLTSMGNYSVETLAHVQVPIKLKSFVVPEGCLLFGNEIMIHVSVETIEMMNYLDEKLLLNDTVVHVNATKINETSFCYFINESIYKTAGATDVTVQLRNFVSEDKLTKEVCVRNPIRDIKCQIPVVWRFDSFTPFQISIISDNNVDLLITFGDGNILSFINIETKQIKYHHFYESAGIFNYSVCASNNVSKFCFNDSIEIIQKVENVTLDHEQILAWPSNKVDFSITFQKSVSLTAKIGYNIYFGDNPTPEVGSLDLMTIQNNKLRLVTHNFTFPGCYEITATIQGKINAVVLKSKVIISNVQAINIDLSSMHANTTSIRKYRADYPLQLAVENSVIGCFSFTWEIFNSSNSLIAQETSTATNYIIKDLLNKPGTYMLKIHINISVVMELETITFDLMNGLPPLALLLLSSLHETKEIIIMTNGDTSLFSNIEINFGDTTKYNIVPEFKVFNETNFTNQLEDKKLPFTNNLLYYFMLTHIYNNTGLYTVKITASNDVSEIHATRSILVSEIYCESPKVHILTSEDTNLVYHYQQKIQLHSSVGVVCGQRKKVIFDWKIFRSSEWEIENKINSEGKDPLPIGLKTSESSFIIERRSLDDGYYIIKLKATIDEVGLHSSDEVYLTIIEDELQVSINGGSYQQLQWKEDVVLDGSSSKDPNEIDQSQLSFEWYCEMLLNVSTDCFGNGLGNIEFFGPKWNIKAKTLLEGTPYEFKLIVKNTQKNRIAETHQKVFLVDAEIPIISLSCQSNCRDFVNPSTRLSLKSSCFNCYQDVNYEWKDISGNLIFGVDTLTNQFSSNFVVKAGVLEGAKNYTFLLKVTKRSGVSSHSEYSIKTNSPPLGGHCGINPNNGTSLITNFKITCMDWRSNIGSVNYRILLPSETKNKNDKLLSFGPSPTSEVLLSAGSEEKHFELNITVEIIDLYGAFTMYKLSAKVFPMLESSDSKAIENVQHELFNMTSGKDNKLDELSGRGDTQGLAQFISTVAESMNQVKNMESDQSHHDEHPEEESVDMTEQRIQMRSAMVDALTKVEVQSTDNIKQKTDAIAPLLEKADEVTSETQKKALETVSQMADFLEQDEEVMEGENPDKVTEITSGLVKATGNLLQAIVSSDETHGGNVSDFENTTISSPMNKQKENLTRKVLQIVDKMMPLLLIGKVAGEEPTRVASDSIALELSRQTSDNLNGTGIETMDGGSINLPKKLFDFGNESKVLDYKMSTLRTNPFAWHSSSQGIDSPISSLSFSTEDNKEVSVSNLDEENQIELFLPQQAPVAKIVVNSSLVQPDKITSYRMNITGDNVALLVSLTIPLDNSSIDIYVRGGKRPTITDYDVKVTYHNHTTGYQLFNKIPSVDVYYLGVYITNHSVSDTPYQIEINLFTTRCLYWNSVKEIWDSQGCKVGPLSTPEKTQCLCNHLTWFASNFIIPPNTLDIEAEFLKLSNLDEYPALLATFCVIIGLFILVLVWARRNDISEKSKGEPTFLRSQSSRTGVTYHVAVYTGHRGGSGTTATPSIILSGEHSDSVPLVLVNNERKLFDRGSVETFLFTTPLELGPMKYVTVWHDDSGDDPSWFLSRMTITNLQDNSQYHCFCNDWLAVDLGDGMIERVLPIATDQEMRTFENIFLARTARDFTDGHLWFSIISRPPRSNFTCVQRVSCVFCLLLSTMLANAMFYNVADSRPAGDEIDMGNIKISWSEIVIGIQSSLIVFPMNFLLVALFRKAKPLAVHEKEQAKKKKLKMVAKAKKKLEKKRDLEKARLFEQMKKKIEDTNVIKFSKPMPLPENNIQSKQKVDIPDKQTDIANELSQVDMENDQQIVNESTTSNINDKIVSVDSLVEEKQSNMSKEMSSNKELSINSPFQNNSNISANISMRGSLSKFYFSVFSSFPISSSDSSSQSVGPGRSLQSEYFSTMDSLDPDNAIAQQSHDHRTNETESENVKCTIDSSPIDLSRSDDSFNGIVTVNSRSQSVLEDINESLLLVDDSPSIKSENEQELLNINQSINKLRVHACADDNESLNSIKIEFNNSNNTTNNSEQEFVKAVETVTAENSSFSLNKSPTEAKDSPYEVDDSLNNNQGGDSTSKKLSTLCTSSIESADDICHTAYDNLIKEIEEEIDHFDASNISINLPDSLDYWPRWVKYIGWILCFITSLITGFFTLLYGLSFGKEGQEQWLISFFASVFSDVLFNQPVKVIVFAAVITLLIRKIKDEYILCEIENFKNATIFEGDMPEVVEGATEGSVSKRPLPPSQSYIEKARKKRIYEAKMVDVVIEIVAYLMYLLLCLLISYGHRDPDAFAMTNNIQTLFIKESFDQIKSTPDFWDWTDDVFANNLFDRTNYNGERIQHDGFLSDGLTYVVGAVQMRQLRVRQQYCIARGHKGVDNTTNCGGIYSEENEDQFQQYCALWTQCRKGENALYPEYWKYHTSSSTEIGSTSGKLSNYGGGGYIVMFGKTQGETITTLNYLYSNLWIDKYTRAVILDFTTYNTNANFYTIIKLLLEVTPFGGAVVSSKVLTTRLDRYSSGFAIFLGVCETLFLCLTIYYMYREFKKAYFLKWDYFKDWRNWLELLSFTCIWTCFGLFIVRFAIVKAIKDKYFEDNSQYVNFEDAIAGDQWYTYLMAFVAFLLYLKMLKILRFNKKISLMVRTVSHASQDLKYFMITFTVYFQAFSQMAYLFFMPTLENYATFHASISSLFGLLLGQFNFEDIVLAKSIFGKIFFLSFIFMMTFILLNMFISILIDSFAVVQDHLKEKTNKYELVDFLLQRLSAFIPVVWTTKRRTVGDNKAIKGKECDKIKGSSKSEVLKGTSRNDTACLSSIDIRYAEIEKKPSSDFAVTVNRVEKTDSGSNLQNETSEQTCSSDEPNQSQQFEVFSLPNKIVNEKGAGGVNLQNKTSEQTCSSDEPNQSQQVERYSLPNKNAHERSGSGSNLQNKTFEQTWTLDEPNQSQQVDGHSLPNKNVHGKSDSGSNLQNKTSEQLCSSDEPNQSQHVEGYSLPNKIVNEKGDGGDNLQNKTFEQTCSSDEPNQIEQFREYSLSNENVHEKGDSGSNLQNKTSEQIYNTDDPNESDRVKGYSLPSENLVESETKVMTRDTSTKDNLPNGNESTKNEFEKSILSGEVGNAKKISSGSISLMKDDIVKVSEEINVISEDNLKKSLQERNNETEDVLNDSSIHLRRKSVAEITGTEAIPPEPFSKEISNEKIELSYSQKDSMATVHEALKRLSMHADFLCEYEDLELKCIEEIINQLQVINTNKSTRHDDVSG